MPQAVDEFHEYLRDRLGGSLRSVVYYDSETERVSYVREDVTRKLSAEQAKRLVGFLRERDGAAEAYDRIGVDANLKCTVRVWEDRIGIQFRHGPETGTVVTMEPTVARDLHSFVSDCESILE